MQPAAANSLFWIDPNGGLPHAESVGAECDIFWPGVQIGRLLRQRAGWAATERLHENERPAGRSAGRSRSSN